MGEMDGLRLVCGRAVDCCGVPQVRMASRDKLGSLALSFSASELMKIVN